MNNDQRQGERRTLAQDQQYLSILNRRITSSERRLKATIYQQKITQAGFVAALTGVIVATILLFSVIVNH